MSVASGAGTESISALNSLFYVDYAYLNGLLKKRGRTRQENAAFLQQFRDEVARVERTFQEHLAALKETRERLEAVDEAGVGEREALLSLARKCALLEEYVSSNRKAVLRVADRFDWLVSGAPASALLEELAPAFLSSTAWAPVEKWVLHRLQAVHNVSEAEVGARKPGDAMGWLGFYGGVFLTLLVVLVVLLSTMDAVNTPMWMPGHRVFRMFLLLSFYLLLLSLDVFIWSLVPVDWAFVFGIDQNRYLRARHYALAAFQIGSLTLAMACGWLLHSRMNPSPDSGSDYWILAVFVGNGLYLFNPLPFGHRRARMWLLRSLGRVVAAPWVGPVQFRDFWLADQFCSLVILLTDLGYAGCFFVVDLGCQTDTCTTKYMPWIRPAFALLPFFLRLLQCLRRFYDLRLPRDLLNAGKYLLSMLVVVFALLHEQMDSSTWGPFRIVWLLFAVSAMLSSYTWDILMDFGIGRPHFCFLRRNLLFPKWCYYFAMVFNLVLRGAWLFTVAPSPFTGYVYEKALEFSLAGAEILRRAHWNLYRLANEQTALMTQLKYVEADEAHELVADTYQKMPKKGHSRMRRVDERDIETMPMLSSDEMPSSTEEEA